MCRKLKEKDVLLYHLLIYGKYISYEVWNNYYQNKDFKQLMFFVVVLNTEFLHLIIQ